MQERPFGADTHRHPAGGCLLLVFLRLSDGILMGTIKHGDLEGTDHQKFRDKQKRDGDLT